MRSSGSGFTPFALETSSRPASRPTSRTARPGQTEGAAAPGAGGRVKLDLECGVLGREVDAPRLSGIATRRSAAARGASSGMLPASAATSFTSSDDAEGSSSSTRRRALRPTSPASFRAGRGPPAPPRYRRPRPDSGRAPASPGAAAPGRRPARAARACSRSTSGPAPRAFAQDSLELARAPGSPAPCRPGRVLHGRRAGPAARRRPLERASRGDRVAPPERLHPGEELRVLGPAHLPVDRRRDQPPLDATAHEPIAKAPPAMKPPRCAVTATPPPGSRRRRSRRAAGRNQAPPRATPGWRRFRGRCGSKSRGSPIRTRRRAWRNANAPMHPAMAPEAPAIIPSSAARARTAPARRARRTQVEREEEPASPAILEQRPADVEEEQIADQVHPPEVQEHRGEPARLPRSTRRHERELPEEARVRLATARWASSSIRVWSSGRRARSAGCLPRPRGVAGPARRSADEALDEVRRQHEVGVLRPAAHDLPGFRLAVGAHREDPGDEEGERASNGDADADDRHPVDGVIVDSDGRTRNTGRSPAARGSWARRR